MIEIILKDIGIIFSLQKTQEGVKHYSMQVVADGVNFGGGKSENSGASQAEANSNAIAQTVEGANIVIGDLGDFEEILSDGEIPF